MHQTVSGCYAHSAIPVVAFRVAIDVAKDAVARCIFANQQWLTSQTTPPWISGNVWFKKDNKESVQYVCMCALVNIKWVDFSKRGCFLLTPIWRIFLVVYTPPDILWGGDSLEGQLHYLPTCSQFSTFVLSISLHVHTCSAQLEGFNAYKLQKLICIIHFTHCTTLSINTGPMCTWW